ncbi:MAG: amino acid-binding protein [Candidatus Bathyarchaeia archaeon]|nr:amino acid-binding protein [Candidatus Bathyarchaeota archaeon]
MWNLISEQLKGHPERLAVARVLVENGLSVKGDKIYCNEIRIPAIEVARAAKVDRRTVTETIRTINEREKLREIFSNLRSAGYSLKQIAQNLGFGVVEITPKDPKTVGILAEAAALIAEEGISIRQALVDDPELSPEPQLTLITEKPLPGELIPKFLRIKGRPKVTIY